MALPKPLGVEDLIRLLEERITKCKEILKVLKDAKLQHPEHIKIKEYYKKRIEKELENHKESVQQLKRFIK